MLPESANSQGLLSAVPSRGLQPDFREQGHDPEFLSSLTDLYPHPESSSVVRRYLGNDVLVASVHHRE